MTSGSATIITADFRKKFELYKIPEYHTYYCDFERLIYYIDQFKLSNTHPLIIIYYFIRKPETEGTILPDIRELS